jgi:hypothetical protein
MTTVSTRCSTLESPASELLMIGTPSPVFSTAKDKLFAAISAEILSFTAIWPELLVWIRTRQVGCSHLRGISRAKD